MKIIISLIAVLFVCNIAFGVAATMQPSVQDKARAVQLNHEGLASFGANKFEDATRCFREATTLDPGVAAYVLNLAKAFQSNGQFAEGKSLLDSRIPDFPSDADHNRLQAALADIQYFWGNALLDQKKDDEAVPHFEASLAIDRVLKSSVEAYDLYKLATAYDEMSQFEYAIVYYEQAVPAAVLFKKGDLEAQVLLDEAHACFNLGRYDKSAALYDQARVIWHGLKNIAGEAMALTSLATVFSHTGRYSQAIDDLNQALAIQRKIKDRVAEATTLTELGTTYIHMGRTSQALALYKQALAFWRFVKDRHAEAITLNDLGLAYDNLSQPLRAIECYETAMPILKEFKDKVSETNTANNLASAWVRLQRYDVAIKLFEQTLAAEREIGSKDGEAATLNNLGEVYDDLGQYDRATEFYNQALVLRQSMGDREGEATADINLGLTCKEMGRDEEAVQYYQKALTIQRQIGDRLGEATVLNNLGGLFIENEKYEQAILQLNQALTICRETKEGVVEGSALNNLGRCYQHLKEFDQASACYQESLIIQHAAKNRMGEAVTLSGLMLLWKDQNKRDFAIFYGKLAVNNYQILRANVQSLDKDTQQIYTATLASSYRYLADLLIEEGRFDEARQVLGMLKEEEFFDFLGRIPNSAKTLLRHADLTPLEAGWAAKYSQLHDGPATVNLLGRAALAFSAPIHVRPAQGSHSAAVGTATIYTIVEPEYLRMIVVTSKGQSASIYPIKSSDLYRKVLAFRNALQDPTHDPRPLGQELYKIIFEPISADLANAHAVTLSWSLDDALRYLPIAALYDGKQYMLERYQNCVLTLAAPSPTELAGQDVSWTGLGFGVTQEHEGFDALPGVRAELTGIIGPVVPGSTLLDAQFTQASFVAALKQHSHRLVHIASHFALSGRDTDSFLLLGDGAHLTMAALLQDPKVFEGIDLMTLSACNTAMEVRSATGKEVEGFGALAQRLGARSVMASLWPVADASTPVLMREFYRLRRSNPTSNKSEDLRRAQIGLLEGHVEPSTAPSQTNRAQRAKVAGAANVNLPAFATDPHAPYAHPYYWAPFVLIGNPK